MQAPVAALLGILDIVLAFHQCDIILSQKTLRKLINIVREGTDDPDPGDIPDILFDAFQRHGNIFSTDLTQNTVIRLDPGLNPFDGIAVVFQGILLIQNLEFRLHLHDGALIIRHQFIHGALVFLNQIQKLIR